MSASTERKWGWVGGLAGAFVGVGSAATAVLIDGAPLFEGGPYPQIFRSEHLLAIDLYMLVVLLAGAFFSAAGVILARRSPYPRTDCYGAGLTGLILSLLAGLILFLRLTAVLAA